ncbi:MAG: hypothetical protein JST01_24400 [Cyanobacteria bacterium SZAS TMP-1]|nr:hypothetical protein [Cyanobacteria bacterium SZAS TMP-1]
MTETTIVIDGSEIPVALVAHIMNNAVGTMATHSQICDQLAAVDDQLYRARMAAAFFSANTAVTLTKLTLAVLESLDVEAYQACLVLSGHMNKAHKVIWDEFQDAFEHKDKPLPDDMETRRAALAGRRDQLAAAIKALNQAALLLPAEGAGVASGLKVANFASVALSEASSSIDFALGTATFAVSDESLKAGIEEMTTMITSQLGKSADEAHAMIVEKLGATAEEQKAAIASMQLAPLAPESEGTRNGALLSAEQELTVAEEALAKAREMLAIK